MPAHDGICTLGGYDRPMSEQTDDDALTRSAGGKGARELDTRHAHSARVYNYWLGGTDVRANRAFLVRAVRFLASECGVRQFLDIGTGLPTASNTHEVAQEAAQDARIVYVDNDPRSTPAYSPQCC